MNEIKEQAYQYVLQRSIPITESGCSIFLGTENGHGYGRFRINNVRFYAHRIAYEFSKGSIPEGLHIDHLCRVRCCVNPDHLEAVSNRTNALRGIGPTAVNASKTNCKNGHVLNGENLYINPASGYRNCRICREMYRAKYYHIIERPKRHIVTGMDLSHLAGEQECV